MAGLSAFEKATRASAAALSAMERENRHIDECARAGLDYTRHIAAYNRAWIRYQDAQDMLRQRPNP